MNNNLDLFKVTIQEHSNPNSVSHIIPLKIIRKSEIRSEQESIALILDNESIILKPRDPFTLFGLNHTIYRITCYRENNNSSEDLLATILLIAKQPSITLYLYKLNESYEQ